MSMPTGIYKRTEYHKRITSEAMKRKYKFNKSDIMGFKKGHADIVPLTSRKIASQKMKGCLHPLWKGDSLEKVNSIHRRIIAMFGQPKYCEHCKRSDRKTYEWSNKNHKYSLNPKDWQRLCRSCHRKFDYKFNKPETV